ncbi:uncharacterized protein LOC109829089 isoform X2 [Asparagus officinalis]|uniref:uncharacterized protein LOC109829089 isoform X2 n=1 Tax=Asparagus officinalis TaxID=4686 RepID=UPI00098E5520|nr:uncharacterized protein LOC109829089 isoform X2 [Asparagus officinalis]
MKMGGPLGAIIERYPSSDGDAQMGVGIIRHNRKCRDLVYLVIFVAFLLAMIVNSSFGLNQGNPLRKSTNSAATESAAICGGDGRSTYSLVITLQSLPLQLAKGTLRGMSCISFERILIAIALKWSHRPRFIQKVKQDLDGDGVKEQLQILCNIYAFSLLHKHLGDFLSTSCINPKQAALANEQLRALYSHFYLAWVSCVRP